MLSFLFCHPDSNLPDCRVESRQQYIKGYVLGLARKKTDALRYFATLGQNMQKFGLDFRRQLSLLIQHSLKRSNISEI